MTDSNHLITPPQWQVDAWCKQVMAMGADVDAVFLEVFRAGADQELEACCKWLAYELRHKGQSLQWADDLRAARRPKPKSQAEEALEALEAEDSRRLWSPKTEKRFDTIRAALERLRELEQSNG